MEKKHSHLKNIRDQRDRDLIQDMLSNFENGYSRVVELYMSQLLSVARNALEGTGSTSI